MEELKRTGLSREFSNKRSIHSLNKVNGPKKEVRNRHKGCYKRNSMNGGSKKAKNKARKVYTVCADYKTSLTFDCLVFRQVIHNIK